LTVDQLLGAESFNRAVAQLLEVAGRRPKV
jgi:hypothetical protein